VNSMKLSQTKSSVSSRASDSTLARRWILVAGTGLKDGTPETDVLAAKAVGEELAKYGYGLVVGGWHGVDYIVTKSFLNQLSSRSLDPRDYLIQVVPHGRQLLHNEGHIIRTPHGGREWLEPQKYADAVFDRSIGKGDDATRDSADPSRREIETAPAVV
jgi:hypothetical protein